MTTGEVRETYNESGLHPPVVSSKGLPQLHNIIIIITCTYYNTHTKHWVRVRGQGTINT